MTRLRLVGRDESPPREPLPAVRKTLLKRWLSMLAFCSLMAATPVLIWWLATTETREIQRLPDGQRIPLYQRTMENLKTICDPAAPRFLRDFCEKEAALVLRFRECAGEPLCQELANRHLHQARR